MDETRRFALEEAVRLVTATTDNSLDQDHDAIRQRVILAAEGFAGFLEGGD